LNEVNDIAISDVNNARCKASGCKAKAKDLSFEAKAKNFGLTAKAGPQPKTRPNIGKLKQESLADAKVSARQQCVYEDPIEEIYSKFAIDG